MRRFEHGRPGPDEVRRLLGLDSPPITRAALVYISVRLDAGEPAASWAPLIPSDVTGQPPEVIEAIAGLHARGLSETAMPAVDARVPLSVVIPWTGARLVAAWGRPGRERRPGPLDPVAASAALDAIEWDRVPDPMAVLDRLSDASDMPSTIARPITRAMASMGRCGRLPAAALVPALAGRLSGPAVDIALDALAEPWSLGHPVAASLLRAALDGVYADRAARALAIRGDRQALRGALLDDKRPLRTHRAALRHVQPGPDSATVGDVLDRALAEPLFLAPAAFDALARYKTAGARISVEEVGAAFAAYLAGPPMRAGHIASTVGHADALRHGISIRLAEVPHCLRSLDLLAALPGGAAHLLDLLEQPAHALLSTAILRHLASEPHRAAPGVARAIAACLDRRPVEAARALAAVIRPETFDAADGLPPRAALALAVQHRPDAVDWSASVRAGAVDEAVIKRLPPGLFGAARADLEAWATSPGHPLRAPAVRALGRLGGRASIAAVSTALTEPEPVDGEGIAVVARAALAGIGARLGSGAALVEAVRLRLSLTHDPATLAALLDTLAGAGRHDIGRVVRPALRHRDPDVRAAAARALAEARDPAATDWLLSRVDEADPRPLRAIFEALGARGDARATLALVAGLEHRLMNLKKTAAEALRRAGDVRAVPRLLFWLGRHDNPGLRALLLAALRARSADIGRLRAALDAAHAAGESERIRRLLPALDRRVPRARLEIWEASAPWAEALRDADLEPRDGPDAAEPEDAGADRRARRRLLAWSFDPAAAAPLAAIAHLDPAGELDAGLFDRLWALYPLPDAPRALIRRHLARGGHLAPARRFAAICALRAATPLDEREHAATTLAALGARPDDDERRRWTGIEQTAGRARDARPEAALRPSGRGGPGGHAAAEVRLDRIDDFARGRVGLREPDREVGTWTDLLHVAGRAAAIEARVEAHRRGEWPIDGFFGVEPAALLLGAEIDALEGARSSDACAEPDVARWAPTERRVERWRDEAGDDRSARDQLDRLGRLDLDARIAMVRAGDLPLGLAGEMALRVVLRSDAVPARPAIWWSRARRSGFTEPATVAMALRGGPSPPGCPASAVVPHLAADLRAGRLDAIGRLPTDPLPDPLLVQTLAAADATDRFAARLRQHFAAAARGGRLHAPGLVDTLLAAPDALDDAGWQALLASTEGDSPAGRDRITAALRAQSEPAVAGARIVDALEGHPPAAQIPLLLPWRAVPAVEARLAALLVDRDPAGRQLIPRALHARLLAGAVATLAGSAPETVKRVLSALVALDAPGTSDRLMAALDHRAPAVRAHAHRLLRRHGSRAVYLDATRQHLLVGRDPQTMRRAIRVLSYGGDVAAVPGIVSHLGAGGPLGAAAHAGLVYLGEPALGPLHKAARRARPDRRPPIEAVIADIEAGLDGLGPEETEHH